MRCFHVRHLNWLALAVGPVLVAAVSACSASGSSSTQNPQNAQGSFSAAPSEVRPTAGSAPAVPAGVSGGVPSDVMQITTSWTTFFRSSTPASTRVRLLQNGSEFASAVSAFASSPLAAAVTSKVDSVALSSATQAKVTYDLSVAGETVATRATGTLVLQDGTWKVGDDVFCGLLGQARKAGLTVTVPAACNSVGGV